MQLFFSRISRPQNQPPTPVLLKCAKLLQTLSDIDVFGVDT
jgi:hypothetical protein